MAKFRRVLSMVMVMCMFATVLPMQALAAEGDPVITYEGELKVSTTTTNNNSGPSTTVEGKVEVTTERNETVIEFTVTDPNGNLVREGGSNAGTEIRTEVYPEEERVVENPTDVPDPADPAVTAPGLEVNFGAQGGKETDSANGAQAPAETENTEVEVKAEGGKTTITSTTTEVTNPNTTTVVPNDPENQGGKNPDGSTTVVETKETVTTVTASTTETVVVTDRTLEAVLNQGTAAGDNAVKETLDADLTALNTMLKDMGIITQNLNADDAAQVLEGMKNSAAQLSESNAAIVAALNAKGACKPDPDGGAEEEAETPEIVVSDVTFKVGDRVEDNDDNASNDKYVTEVSFTVVIENDVAGGTTTVTVYSGSGENRQVVKQQELKPENMVDGKYVLTDLQLAENMNYDLQFDFAAENDLGADAYVYNATIETQIEEEVVAVDESKKFGDGKVDGDKIKESFEAHGVSFEPKTFNGPTSKVHAADLAVGLYVVSYIDSKGVEHKFPAKVNNGGNLDIATGKGYDFEFPAGQTKTFNFIYQDGTSGTITFAHQEGNGGIEPDNGTNNYQNGVVERKMTTASRTETDNYSYGFSNEKTQNLSASKALSLNFSVNESVVSSNSESEVVETVKKTVTKTTTWNNKWEENYEVPPAGDPEDPAVYRLNHQGGDGLEEIADEEVPLAAPVTTGDNAIVWVVVIAMSMLMLCAFNLAVAKRPRGKHEAI